MRGEGIGFPVSRLYSNPRTELVDVTPVREHIARLESVGMTIAMIARAAGVTDTQVSYYKAGQPTTRKVYADAVLAVDGRPSKHQAFVLGVGSVRRLRGLAVLGFTSSVIGEAAGLSWSNVSRIRNQSGPVLWETHELVRSTFDSLGVDGGSEITKRHARRRGWVHPLLWDDIDDPFGIPCEVVDSGLPDPVAVARLVEGKPVNGSPADREAAFHALVSQGVSMTMAAVRVGFSHAKAKRLVAA